MRSDVLNIKKDFSFDAERKGNKSEAKKRANNATLNHTVAKPSLDKKKFSKVRQNLKLRNFSNSSKNEIDAESIRSGSRRSRLSSNASSRGKLNLQEFSNLKFTNERYKKALTSMVGVFSKFKSNFEQVSKPKASSAKNEGASSESGSSIVWKDKAQNSKYLVSSTNPDAVDIVMANGQGKIEHLAHKTIHLDDEKDKKIAQLLKQLEEKDKLISDLQKQLVQKK